MQISYGSAKLMNICLVLDEGERAFGRTVADDLTRLIAEAEAFDCVPDWLEFIGEDLPSPATKLFQVSFGSVYVATFVAIDRYQVVDAAGRLDWSTVQYVKLTEISERT